MFKRFALAAAVPLAAVATIVPAQAATTGTDRTVKAASVTTATAPGAYPLRAVRSSTVRCAGTLVSRTNAMAGKTLVGTLEVYGSKANGGTMVACFRHAGATAHKRLPTSVSVVAAKSARATKPAVAVVASGNFISWAGPAAVSGVRGNCFQAAGAVKYMGKAVAVTTPAVCTK